MGGRQYLRVYVVNFRHSPQRKGITTENKRRRAEKYSDFRGKKAVVHQAGNGETKKEDS